MNVTSKVPTIAYIAGVGNNLRRIALILPPQKTTGVFPVVLDYPVRWPLRNEWYRLLQHSLGRWTAAARITNELPITGFASVVSVLCWKCYLDLVLFVHFKSPRFSSTDS